MNHYDRFLVTLRTMHQSKTILPPWAHMPWPKHVEALWPHLTRKSALRYPGRESPPYMRSFEWRQRRAVVLLLSGCQCVRCTVRRATQVHHKTYERWQCELLADLDPVCGGCHCRIHGIVRGHDLSIGLALSDLLDKMERRVQHREPKPKRA